MPTITNIVARQILDSRGNPTVEADVVLSSGHTGRASVPSGASTGKHEAVERRDGDKEHYDGKSVFNVIESLETEVLNALRGMNATKQEDIDEILIDLDGTENKSRLGANATLAVSLATARAAASFYGMPLYRYIGGINAGTMPVPMMNIINGGAHADNAIDIQEFMIVPYGADSFEEALHMGVHVFQTLKDLLKKDGHSTNVGDEGGFAPNLSGSKQALTYITKAIETAGYDFTQIHIALDAAATEFYKNGKYHLAGEDKILDAKQLVSYYKDLCDAFPILSIEDGCAEDDLEGWKHLTAELGEDIQIVGDDLFVTNLDRLYDGIAEKQANAILIKPNQIGTLTETLRTIEEAQRSQFETIISHRSGETEDTFIADLAVATNAGQIKTGAPSRTDRVAKYNQLLRISEELYE